MQVLRLCTAARLSARVDDERSREMYMSRKHSPSKPTPFDYHISQYITHVMFSILPVVVRTYALRFPPPQKATP